MVRKRYLSPHLIKYSIISPTEFISVSFIEEDEDIFEIDTDDVPDAEPGEGGAAKGTLFEWE